MAKKTDNAWRAGVQLRGAAGMLDLLIADLEQTLPAREVLRGQRQKMKEQLSRARRARDLMAGALSVFEPDMPKATQRRE